MDATKSRSYQSFRQITKVKEVEPEGMIGLWKGVSQDDIDSIPLEG